MRFGDRVRGRRAFRLTHTLGGVFSLDPEATCGEEDETMAYVQMETLAKFHAMVDDERHTYMKERAERRNQRQQQPPDKRTGGRPHGAIISFLETHHWKTDDINQLDENIPGLIVRGPGEAKRTANGQELLRHYVAKWREEQVNYSRVDAVMFDVSNLRVRVNPEIGMQPWDSRSNPRVLKLWLNGYDLPCGIRDAYLYLLGEVAAIAEWGAFTQLGVWDVRNRHIEAGQPPADIALRMRKTAAEFLRLQGLY